MTQITKILFLFLLSINYVQPTSAQTWIAKANIQQSASGRGAAQSFVLNSKLYVVGGYVGFTAGYTNDMQMFDPSSNTWTTKASPTESNRSSGVAFVINGKAYVGLGAKNLLSFSPPETILTDMNEYNDATNTWTSKATFPDSGRTSAASFVLNNKAYIVGGEKGVGGIKTAEVWEYNATGNTWTKKNDFLGGGIAYASAFTIGSKAYIVGGILSDASVSNKTYEYDATTDIWTAKANLPVINQGGVAFTIGNDGYYGLGSDKSLGATGAVFPTTFYKYNATANTWAASTYNWTTAGRLWGIAGVINNKAYVGAGYKFASGEIAYKDLFELAFAPTAIDNFESNSITLCYPNPAQDILYINSMNEYYDMEIYSITGQQVYAKNNLFAANIDISDLSNGHYILIAKNKEHIIKQKISINR